MRIQESREFIIKKASETVPSMRYDGKEDFETWRKRASDKLYELLGLPFEPCDDMFEITAKTDCGNYTRIDFNFQSEEGYFVPAVFLMPKGRQIPLKTVVCIQGHTSGMHVSMGEEKFSSDKVKIVHSNFAEQAIKEGYCAVILEQRYMGICGQSDEGVSHCITRGSALPSLLLGRTAIGERVWDVQRLLDVIIKYFSEYIDSEQIICMGNSGGGTITFYASCLDERIKLAVPSCAVTEFDYSIIPIHHCSCNYIPGIRRFFEMGDIGGLIAPRKLVLVYGIQDPDFPIEGSEKSYDRIRSVYKHIGRENNCRIVKGPEGHQFYPELAWPVINELIMGD